MYDEILQSVLKVLIDVLLPVVLVAVVAGIKELIAWVKGRIKEQHLEIALALAAEVVKAAEQNGLAGYIKNEAQVKREWALAQLELALAKRGIRLDLDELYLLIEAQVMEAFNQYKVVE